MNMAQSIRNYGDGAMAELVFSKALAIDSGYASSDPPAWCSSPHLTLSCTPPALQPHSTFVACCITALVSPGRR